MMKAKEKNINKAKMSFFNLTKIIIFQIFEIANLIISIISTIYMKKTNNNKQEEQSNKHKNAENNIKNSDSKCKENLQNSLVKCLRRRLQNKNRNNIIKTNKNNTFKK